MTRTMKVVTTALVVSAVGVTAAVIVTAKGPRFGRATLEGFQEIPTLSTPARGRLVVTVSPDESFLRYTLRYDGFGTPVQQAHIHLGRPAFNGGIMVFLCTNLAPPAGVPVPPACPLGGGVVSGTLSAADVVGPSAQGISVGEFSEVIDALRGATSYGNVHTQQFPGGEIRGLVEFNDRDRDDDHDRDHRW